MSLKNTKLKLEHSLDHYNTSLSRQGYSIHKNNLTSKELDKIKELLTVKASVSLKYADAQPSFPVFGENDKKIYVPRYWGITHFGEPKINKLTNGDCLGKSINIKFKGGVRKTQQPIVDAFMDKIKTKKEGGIITLHCGGGKTVTTLYLISLIKKKTLVIVHKSFLMNQWSERSQEFLPDARVGFLQRNIIDVHKKDIVIGMLHSISMKDYPKNIFKDFGFVVFDECHHLGAEVFSKALSKSACPYTLGLSATPNRKDGLSKVFVWYLGDFVYKSAKQIDNGVDVKMYYYLSDDPSYSTEAVTYTNRINTPRMVNNICYCKRRNDLIIHLLPKLIKQKRNILIISERKEQLTYLGETIKSLKIASFGYYLGGMKQSDLNESETKDIMLGTYGMVSEGFDCKRLNTLILASPRSDVEQSIGRILRLEPHKRTIKPLVIDIGDLFSIYISQLDKRIRYYEKEKYNITGYMIDDNLVKAKITKMERYFDVPDTTGKYTIIKLRRMNKIEKSTLDNESNMKKGVCMMD